MMRAFLNLCLIFWCVSASGAVNGTTPTSLLLESTFESISVTATYTGDEDKDNSAVIQFSTGGTWKNAYTPYLDRRVSISHLLGTFDNVNSNQARVSIVGLLPATTYSVRVEWTDADGITGAAAITNTVTTLSYTLTLGGSTYFVDSAAGSEGVGSSGDPFKTITNAHRKVTTGDTVKVRNGSYEFPAAWTNSGTASGWIYLVNDFGASPSIKGGTRANSAVISANYLCLDGFAIDAATNSSVVVSLYASYVRIQNCTFTNVALDLATACCDAGIRLGGSDGIGVNTNVFLLTNRFGESRLTWLTGGTNIYAVSIGASNRTIVVSDNIATNFWDPIGTGNGFGHGIVYNGDIARNTFINYSDDSTELEGDFNNVRFNGNIAHSTNGISLLGLSGPIVGPVYIFRNVLTTTNILNGYGIKHSADRSTGRAYLFHNVISTRDSNGSGARETIAGGTNTVALNNILLALGNIYYGGNFTTDYNCVSNNPGAFYSDPWNGTTYETFAAFQSGTGQDSHSVFAVPLFTTGAYTLQATSPAKDAALLLDNFNTQDGAFGYSGSAPDIGAFEFGGYGSLVPGSIPSRTGPGRSMRPVR